MKRILHLPFLLLLAMALSPARAEDLASLCADRTALEQVYHAHRLGPKPPFEQAMPRALIEQLVREDQHKEAVLQKSYGVVITPALLTAEMQRINATTRAPEMLAEIKAALGNDPARFGRTFAQPLLVERLLRERFDNDDPLHVLQRQQVERTRKDLLGIRTHGANLAALLACLKRSHSNNVTETTWQLALRPAETNASAATELAIKQRFGPNAQLLSAPPAADRPDRKSYFEDLPGELQNVLRVQLRRPGDVSAVIETPGGFLLYVAKERTDIILSVTFLSLPKRSYEQWLSEQTQSKP